MDRQNKKMPLKEKSTILFLIASVMLVLGIITFMFIFMLGSILLVSGVTCLVVGVIFRIKSNKEKEEQSNNKEDKTASGNNSLRVWIVGVALFLIIISVATMCVCSGGDGDKGEGKCSICGRPVFVGRLCEKHFNNMYD